MSMLTYMTKIWNYYKLLRLPNKIYVCTVVEKYNNKKRSLKYNVESEKFRGFLTVEIVI